MWNAQFYHLGQVLFNIQGIKSPQNMQAALLVSTIFISSHPNNETGNALWIKGAFTHMAVPPRMICAEFGLLGVMYVRGIEDILWNGD